MATLTTPNMGLPYPDDDEFLKDVPDFIRVLAQALDKGKLPAFGSDASRSAGIPTPAAGAICWMTNSSPTPRLMVYNGSSWVQVFPALPAITSGTAAPSGTPAAGTLYFQYT